MNLKVGTRILISNLLLIALVVLTGTVGWFGFSAVRQVQQSNYDNHMVSVRQLGEFDARMQESIRELMLAMQHDTALPVVVDHADHDIEDHTAPIRRHVLEMRRQWDEFMARDLSAEDRRLAEAYQEKRSHFLQEGLFPAMEMLEESEFVAAGMHVNKVTIPAFNAARTSGRVLLEQQFTAARAGMEHSDRLAELFVWLLAGVALLSFIVLNFSLWVSRHIVRPLNALSQTLDSVAFEGDFSRRVEVKSRDEVGQMSEGVNRFLETLNHTIGDVSGVMGAISKGNLSCSIDRELAGDLGRLKDGVNQSLDNFRNTMASLHAMVEDLAHGRLHGVAATTALEGAFAQTLNEAEAARLKLSQALSAIAGVMDAIAHGEFGERVSDPLEGDLEAMRIQFNDALDDLGRAIASVVGVTQAQAQCDFTRRIEGEYEGQLLNLQQAINASTDSVSRVVAEVAAAAESIREAVIRIAQDADTMARQIEGQAASIEETSSTMAQISDRVQTNASAAIKAGQMAVQAREMAESGVQVAVEAVTSMQEMRAASARIGDIVGLINSIAFQTNLLALNAAVEAARAGEQGRGFAVVASEVRSLASRVADAAKEIKGLIETSSARVDEGVELVERTGKSLEEIVGAVNKLASFTTDITDMSRSQADEITEVNHAVSTLSEANQRNTVLVDKVAHASKALQSQAEGLAALMEMFTLNAETRRNATGSTESMLAVLEEHGHSLQAFTQLLQEATSQEATQILSADATREGVREGVHLPRLPHHGGGHEGSHGGGHHGRHPQGGAQRRRA